jgi:hypothetical protein
MSEREVTIRTAVVTYFPMFIAVLSLVTSIYNGYLNGKFVDIIQRNFGRTEYLRTCKEIIDAYFQVKFRAGLVSESSERDRAGGITSASTAQIDAASAVSKFAALGTYLANTPGFHGSSTRRCGKRPRHHPPSSTNCSSRPTGFSPT